MMYAIVDGADTFGSSLPIIIPARPFDVSRYARSRARISLPAARPKEARTTEYGWLLYVLLAALLALFWKHGGGQSLDALVARDMALHHQVHRVIKKHPKGGSWRQHLAWMREEA